MKKRIPSHFDIDPIPLVRQYVGRYGVHKALFEPSLEEHTHDISSTTTAQTEPLGSIGTSHAQWSRSESEENVGMLMSEVQMLVERLRQSGVGEIALHRLFKPTQELSRIHIRYGRIFLFIHISP